MNRLNLKSGIHDNFSTPVTAQPTKQNQSAVQRAPQQRRKSRDHESPRSFFAPVHYERGYAYPLLVWLHENGSNHQELRQVMPHVSVRNYVAASIRGTIASTADRRAYSWDDSDAGAIEAGELIDQCIEEAAERFNIHRGRVFIVGRGAGGYHGPARGSETS
jgi:phospholipase/carboxylesterase